ncbi:MAG TPA: ribonuclease H-like domain-containing protein [Chloroflexota bacterium]
MELRDRLARLGYFQRRSGTATTEQAATRAPAAQTEPSSRPGYPDVCDLVEGQHRSCPDGRCFVAETRYPLDHVHAGAALSDLLAQSGEAFALLTGDGRLSGLDPTRAVLLDCETTGLAGGTGTYLFLIGLGYFADGRFCVDQFFLRDPSEERAALGVLGEVLGRFEAVITFNGKCFDWPLMETRHLYARVLLQPQLPLHLDLLFPARRLFKRRLGSCSLGDLERGVLGLPPRQGDVPGWLIPTLYFEYLRRRDGRALLPVFEHNRADILAMLALAVRMARHVSEPHTAPPHPQAGTRYPAAGWVGYPAPDTQSLPMHPLDLYCLGRLLEEAGQPDAAVLCFERALAELPPSEGEEVQARIAGVYKRLRDTDRAVQLWRSLIEHGARSIYPYVELAKHLEHGTRDFDGAADLTRRALGLHGAAGGYTPPGRYYDERADLERRLARLERKLARAR